MGQKALIPLPTGGIPSTNRCVQVLVPDSPEFLGMFYGALYQLTVWDSYDRDDTHLAKDVADTWKVVVSDARNSSCTGGPFCASWHFADDAYADFWEVVPITTTQQNHSGAYVSGVGYSVSATAGTAGYNILLTLHLHTSVPIVVDYAEITWEAGSAVYMDHTVGVMTELTDFDGNHGWFVLTAPHGFDIPIRDYTGIHSKAGQDFYIQVQAVSDLSAGNFGSATLLIADVRLFGSGGLPTELEPFTCNP
jgi:hypothetical protein